MDIGPISFKKNPTYNINFHHKGTKWNKCHLIKLYYFYQFKCINFRNGKKMLGQKVSINLWHNQTWHFSLYNLYIFRLCNRFYHSIPALFFKTKHTIELWLKLYDQKYWHYSLFLQIEQLVNVITSNYIFHCFVWDQKSST